jgi:hypothetical protein
MKTLRGSTKVVKWVALASHFFRSLMLAQKGGQKIALRASAAARL